jgi:hypothetical protein
VFGFVIMIIVRVVPGLQISIDFTKAVSFESAPVSIFSQSLDPGRLPAPEDEPVSITTEFSVDPRRRNQCIERCATPMRQRSSSKKKTAVRN